MSSTPDQELVFLQSTDCQRAHWKLAHKDSCIPHHGLMKPVDAIDASGSLLREPGMGTEERRILDMGKKFSKWMDTWRPTLVEFALVSLDLANYPERAKTHCTAIWTHPNTKPHTDKLRDFVISRINIYTLERIVEILPDMVKSVGKMGPGDVPLMPFITVLDDPLDAQTRTRVLQCKGDPNFLAEYINRDKGYSKICAQLAEHNLRIAADTLDPTVAGNLFRAYEKMGQIPMLQPSS
ncbi:uncharacterized protein PHACADRAFT_198655 [Phanerochaete carnosa HHB-10118-sp]|uniref:Uncharacterized protein n=1 Tax=Phanerochaete carnosa (strain HHB-10118-sp) TaxID=650164 RepID=K5URT2_PHACS|nr:uncharacterized protein PHACADRAFT_198655 [Phanerochaete carnosa HHB-10118-sp]EKM52606.1 hypothetical protein PHACADRAFT_198655 [Phanerochaete carnosa HHB-10118-sp]